MPDKKPEVVSAVPAPNGVSGQPRLWLHLEGIAALGVTLFAYSALRNSWGLFAILFLVPDLSIIGYLAGPRIGAVCYNIGHTYVLPLAIGLILYLTGRSLSLPLIWTAHIAFDRAMGYGLKYDAGFAYTHLMNLGKKRVEP